MVDGKTMPLRNPKLTSKRVARYISSRSSSASSSFNISRPPVVLDIGASVVRIGYAEQFKPQFVIPILLDEDENNATAGDSYRSEADWYAHLSPMVNDIFDRLMIKASSRRFVVVHAIHPQRTWEKAMTQHLWNRGVPAITMVTSLDMIPVAHGWKRGLVVEVSRDEAVCVAHVDGHILPFTLQRVPCGYKSAFDVVPGQWTQRMDQVWLDEDNPNSITVAVLKCLEACPIDVRRYVVGNIIFAGDAVALAPDLGRRVGKKLKEILGDGEVAQQQQAALQEDAPQDLSSEPEMLTIVPIKTSALKSLSNELGITSCAPYRPDHIAWVGTCLWASVWYKYDDDETRINWIHAPEDS